MCYTEVKAYKAKGGKLFATEEGVIRFELEDLLTQGGVDPVDILLDKASEIVVLLQRSLAIAAPVKRKGSTPLPTASKDPLPAVERDKYGDRVDGEEDENAHRYVQKKWQLDEQGHSEECRARATGYLEDCSCVYFRQAIAAASRQVAKLPRGKDYARDALQSLRVADLAALQDIGTDDQLRQMARKLTAFVPPSVSPNDKG